jgi:GntR family transcriptional repressor for pyruvate dehydrogenase complex
MFEKRDQVHKKGKLSETIMSEIMEKIIDDEEGTIEYLPSEAELTEIFNVSRATIREAIKGLEERGFVERQQGKGIKIINKSIEVVSSSLHAMILRSKSNQLELLEVRKIIELQTAFLAATRASETDLLEFQQSIDVMNSTTASEEEYILNDLKFHILVAKASKNNILEAIMKALTPLLEVEIQLTLESDFRPERTMKFHQHIFERIAQKDALGAEKCMREHLEATEKMILEANNNKTIVKS